MASSHTDPDQPLSQSELARELSVSRQYIGRLVSEGKLMLGDDDKITLTAATGQLAKIQSPAHVAGAALRAEAEGRPASATSDTVAADKVMSYTAARAMRESMQAQIARLDLEERRSRLLDRQQVEALLAALIAEFKQSLSSIPPRITDNMPRPAAKKTISALNKEHDAMLISLADRIDDWFTDRPLIPQQEASH